MLEQLKIKLFCHFLSPPLTVFGTETVNLSSIILNSPPFIDGHQHVHVIPEVAQVNGTKRVD